MKGLNTATIVLLLGIFSATVAAAECRGEETNVDTPGITLPDDPMVAAGRDVVVDLPAILQPPADGASVVLGVNLTPVDVGGDPFIVAACLDAACETGSANSLDNMAFFPPPQIGKDQTFYVQIPGQLLSQDGKPHKLHLRLEPVRATGEVGTAAVTINSIDIQK